MPRDRLAKIFCFILGAAAWTGLWFSATLPALANQEIYQPALLISVESEQTLAIYPDPSYQQAPLGYGKGGDKIIVLEQIYNNQGDICDRIRLIKSPQLEGWIADAYVRRELSEKDSVNPYEQGNQYYSQDDYSQGNFVQHFSRY